MIMYMWEGGREGLTYLVSRVVVVVRVVQGNEWCMSNNYICVTLLLPTNICIGKEVGEPFAAEYSHFFQVMSKISMPVIYHNGEYKYSLYMTFFVEL